MYPRHYPSNKPPWYKGPLGRIFLKVVLFVIIFLLFGGFSDWALAGKFFLVAFVSLLVYVAVSGVIQIEKRLSWVGRFLFLLMLIVLLGGGYLSFIYSLSQSVSGGTVPFL